MTFDAFETSREDGQVVELFQFIFGATSYRYTNNQADITLGGLTYTATQVSRSRLEDASSDAQRRLTITVPLDNEVAQLFIGNVPGRRVTIKVYRAHSSDPAEELLALFDGYVANVTFDGDLEAKILCNPATDSLNRSAPRMTFQGLCNHVLYDANCQVNRLANAYTGLVSAVTGSVITVNGLAASGADWAVGGFVSFPPATEDDKRLVVSQSGDDVELLLPFAENVLGSDVTVYAGCDHSLATCQAKFANVLNFGGFPFVPSKNPFNSDLRGGS